MAPTPEPCRFLCAKIERKSFIALVPGILLLEALQIVDVYELITNPESQTRKQVEPSLYWLEEHSK